MHDGKSIFGAHEQAAKQLLGLIERKIIGHVLVTGISGVGKTFFLKRVLEHLGEPYDLVSCGQLFDAETGGTERKLAHLLLKSDKRIVVLDDIDSIAGKLPNAVAHGVEHRVASVLRKCLDATKVLVFGVTSRSDIIDTPMTRSGRLCHNVHISISTSEQRFLLLQDIIADGILSRDEMLKLSKMTHGYSAADFEKLYALATLTAIRRQESNTSISVALADFESSLLQMRPSIIADLPAIPLVHSMPHLIGVDAIRAEILVSDPECN